MIDIETFRKIAHSFPGTEEKPHFERASFKVIKKRIFATLHEESETANLALAVTDQRAFCCFDEDAIYPVPNKFGLRGWTTFELKKLPAELITEALFTAYSGVLEKKTKKSKITSP